MGKEGQVSGSELGNEQDEDDELGKGLGVELLMTVDW